MSSETWTDDACSLVDAFRAGERSPREELESSLAAIASSDLNCFSFLDPERALAAAERADVSLPFGGLPVGIKELEPVAGWPQTEASLVFKDRVATDTSTVVERLLGIGGAVPVGLTTASEFGGLNVSVTKLNGVTHNPWRHGKTTGGSSAGSAAAVAGGLVPLATGGDGGGSIRIPAGYTGLLGMKGTYGRIPRGPHAYFTPGTIVLGCLARSVRDAARYFDVCGGYDSRDPWSLPKRTNWEANLGTNDLRGKRVGIVPNLGGVTLEPGVEENLRNSAKQLIVNTGMVEVDLDIDAPESRRAVDDGQPLHAARRSRRPLAEVRDATSPTSCASACCSRSRCTTSTPRRSPKNGAFRRTWRWPTRSTRSTSSSPRPIPVPRSRPTRR